MNKDQILEKLTQLAYAQSTPFCYMDYIKCPTGRCSVCGSDDLMLITNNDGPEYGVDWIIQRILNQEITPVDLEKTFEESHEDIYGEEINIAWCKFNPLEVVKQLDPISWKIAIDEWSNQMEEEEEFFTLDNGTTYYQSSEIENFLNKGS